MDEVLSIDVGGEDGNEESGGEVRGVRSNLVTCVDAGDTKGSANSTTFSFLEGIDILGDR